MSCGWSCTWERGQGEGEYEEWSQNPSEDRKKANEPRVFKKNMELEPGNGQPVSLTLIPAKLMEQTILETVSQDERTRY
ncbi:hypothetical protein AV530_015337 [Patagioenas fasciata monilis]|uniref:Uncharacterized protein n=1 Tax=Patagioenas fasciata monilis TaxID=372326 RepID=A0A1V4JLC1_PATFA|nr:hypothetical protein AV530_015337 [Patagioenas fasciata monilis]